MYSPFQKQLFQWQYEIIYDLLYYQLLSVHIIYTVIHLQVCIGGECIHLLVFLSAYSYVKVTRYKSFIKCVQTVYE